jgi:hypothetical protein
LIWFKDKRIEELENRLIAVEQKYIELESLLYMRVGKLDPYLSFSCWYRDTRPKMSIRDVMTRILNYLDVELKHNQGYEYTQLVPKEKEESK